MPSIDDDEALARRLAAEEEGSRGTKTDESHESPAPGPAIASLPLPPAYTTSPSQTGSDVASLMSTSTSGTRSINDTFTPQRRPLSADASTSSELLSVPSSSVRQSTISLPSLSEESEDSNVLSANQFVDSELLVGFCESRYSNEWDEG
jgi:hypothetical protein